MKLKQKREILKRFMAGYSIQGIFNQSVKTDRPIASAETECLLRDYMNGKFTLRNMNLTRSRPHGTVAKKAKVTRAK